jgi:hypothetical protein
LVDQICDSGIKDSSPFESSGSKSTSNILLELVGKEGFLEILQIENEYLPERTSIYHLKVHQQYASGVCGYHASFNLISVLNAIKYA